MECHEVRKRLKAFMDSELNPEERMRIQEHMVSCPGCAQELEKFFRTWDILAKLPAPSISPDLLPRILERIESGETKGFIRRFGEYLIVQPTPVLAGLALLIGLFLGGKIGGSLYSSAIAPQVELKRSIAKNEPFYLEAFADLAPNSLEDVYFQLSAESEREGKS